VKLRPERIDHDGVAVGAGGQRFVLVDEISALRFCGKNRRRITLRGPGLDRAASTFHLSRPPSSTDALSKPSDLSIHQKRVAHIAVPML